jgi:biotin carboxyl carrier protein
MPRNALLAFSLTLAAVLAAALAVQWRSQRLAEEARRDLVDARCSAELKRLPRFQGIVTVGSDTDGDRVRSTITITPPEGVPVVWGGVRGPTDPFRFRDLPVPGVRLDGPTRFESEWVDGSVRSWAGIRLQIGPKLWSGDEADALAARGIEARFPLADAAEIVSVASPTLTLRAAMGVEVRSPLAGVVVEAEDRFRDLGCPPGLANGLATFPIRNRLALHTDEGLRLELLHLQQGSLQVAPGDRVERGQVLARVGRSGDTPEERLVVEAAAMTLGPLRAVPFRFTTVEGETWTPRAGEVPEAVRQPD